MSAVARGVPIVERVTPAALEAWRRLGEAVTVLDVRGRERWAEDPARIPGAVWVPADEVPRRARDLDPGARIVVYCS